MTFFARPSAVTMKFHVMMSPVDSFLVCYSSGNVTEEDRLGI